MNAKGASDDELSPVEIRRIEARWKSDVDLKLDRMDLRLQIIERLVWTAVGGVVVIAAIATVGIAMLLDQAKKIESVSLIQAAGIAQRQAHIEALKMKDSELQAQIDKLRDARR